MMVARVVLPRPGGPERRTWSGLAAGARGFEGDGELVFCLGLTDELGEAGGAELELKGLIVVDAGGGDEAVGFGAADGDGGFGMRLFGKFHAKAIVGRMAG